LSLEDFDAKVSPSTFNFLILAMGLLLFLDEVQERCIIELLAQESI
jgi:hypothetical protein